MKSPQETYSISKVRADLYRLVDQVLETGEPVTIKRHGRTVRLVPDVPAVKLANLKRRPEYLGGDPEEIVHLDWSDEWHPEP